MSIELASVVALVFALTTFGVSAGIALIGSAAIGAVLLLGLGKLTPFVASAAFNTLTIQIALAAVLLIVIGALLEHTGTVLGLPSRPAGSRADPDRAAWMAGGALGVPLPVAASLVFVGVITETSIGRLTVAALIPGVALSALYLLVFGLSRLVRRPPLELGTETDGPGAVAIVFRCVVPVACAIAFVAPIHAGLATPVEAAALVAVIGLVFTVALALASRPARGGVWPGFSAGAAGAAVFLLTLVGVTVFAQLFTLGAVPRLVTETLAPFGLNGQALTGIAAAAALVAGIVVGPLAAVGLATAAGFGVLAAAGVDATVAAVTLFLTAEAVRVGPRLWRGGFLRRAAGLGSWPNYLAALAVTAGYVVLFG